MTDTPAAKAKDSDPKEQFLVKLIKTHPPAAAGILLGMFLLPPATLLVLALPEGWSGWCTASVVIMSAALIPSLGTLFRFSWANAAGQYLCWAELIQVALRIVSTGFKPIHALPAGAAVLALLTLTSAQAAPGATKERAPEALGPWIKENIEAIVVAFIMALVIRCFCIEVFKIPSSSMEPTLLGDVSDTHSLSSCAFKDEHRFSNGGDRIMVTKYYYGFSSIERYDVVVFKFPLNQAKNFIKRVVGLPDEHLKVYRGNIYTKKPGENAFRIARRTLRTQDSIWIPVDGAVDYLQSDGAFRDHWRMTPADGKQAEAAVKDRELTTLEKAGERSVRFEHQGAIRDGSGQEVGELQIAFDFELTSPQGRLFAEVANEFGYFRVDLSTEPDSELRFHAGGRGKPASHKVALKDLKLIPDRRHHLALSVYDGRVTVRLDGSEIEHHDFITTREDAASSDAGDRFAAFGAQGVTFKARKLMLGRDIYYKGKRNIDEDSPVTIGPGKYVMMGDNVENSHDARSWTRRAYQLADGRGPIIYEEQDRAYDRTKCQETKEKYGLETEPDLVLKADEYGNEWALYNKDPGNLKGKPFAGVIAEEVINEAFFEVDEKFVVGKALWIWWPQGRWFKLIR